MNAPSRNVRRRLERRADAVLARVHARLCGYALAIIPSEHVAMAREPAGLLVFDLDSAELAFGAYGLLDFLDEINAARAKNPMCLPVAIVVDGWTCAAWLPLTPLSMGGQA